MRYWDTSGLVPLIVEEPTSKSCRDLVRNDDQIAVWILTRVEIVSALWRKERGGELARPAIRTAVTRLDALASAWTVVEGVPEVTARAERLLGAHPLRAADALQLAAAVILTEEKPRGWSFVTADQRLADAAEAEGFETILPS